MKSEEGTFKKTRESLGQHLDKKFAEHVLEKGLSTPQALATDVLRMLKVEPVYTQSEKPEFSEMRRKLNEEPGVLIANHPSGLDAFLLLKMIERKDIKIITSGNALSRLSSMFPEQYFYGVTGSSTAVRKQIQDMTEHIQAGGLLVFFPTGGEDQEAGKGTSYEFKGLFGHLLKEVLSPSDMIYSCWIDPNDIKSFASEKLPRKAGVLSEIILPGDFNVNSLRENGPVRIDERCADVGEWREVISGMKSGRQANQTLTRHFLDQFGQKEISEVRPEWTT